MNECTSLFLKTEKLTKIDGWSKLYILLSQAKNLLISSLLASLHGVRQKGIVSHICQESPQVLWGSSQLELSMVFVVWWILIREDLESC